MVRPKGLGELIPLFETNLNHIYHAKVSKKQQSPVHAGAFGELTGFYYLAQSQRIFTGIEDSKNVFAGLRES